MTILANVPDEATALTSEPFGPIAIVAPFDDFDEAIARRTAAALVSPATPFTQSHKRAVAISEWLEVGVLGINSFAVSHTEAPFGGVKESGYGYEGGTGGLAGFLHHKYVHHA